MNIIKIENVRRINSTLHSIEVLSDYYHTNRNTTIVVVIDEEDINNDNCLIKLKDYDISCVIMPNKYKYLFNDSPTGKLMKKQLMKNVVFSYY